MSNLIPFEGGNLPAHLQRTTSKSSDLTAGVGAGIARLSIKGKTWAVLKGEDRTVLMNPKDPDSPATFVGVVIVAASPDLSRTYYEAAFDDKQAASQPDCSSANGKTPDAGVPSPQSKSCATCPHAVYGTGAGGKGFRCSNHRRLVVAKPGFYDEEQAMLLNVPGGSLKNLRGYASVLDQRKVDYDMVLTKLSFAAEEATPKIEFSAAAFLSEEDYNAVQELAKSGTVQSILGDSEAVVQDTADAAPSGDIPLVEAPAEAPAEPEVDAAAEAAAKKKAAAVAKKKAAAEAAKKAAEEAARLAAEAEAAAEDDEDEDEVVVEAAAPAPAEEKKTDELSDDLDDMLADFDD